MSFGAPYWLVLGPLLAAGWLTLRLFSARQGRRALAATFNTPLLAQLLGSVDPVRRGLRVALMLLALLAVSLALARPRWGRSEIEIERTGVDVVVALDVSRSMLAADAGGTNRLAAATGAIRRWLAELGGDRVGLLVFAGDAFVATPLTRDHTAIERALASAGPDLVSDPGSNLGDAIKRARDVFDRASQGPRALLVVSDGEQLQGDAQAAARAAAAARISVHTAGVGSAVGARVPRRYGGPNAFARNPLGREVVSRRDELQLQRIAEAGGGWYTRIDGPDSAALTGWFGRVAASLPRTTEKRMVNEPRERYQWPLALALGLLVGEYLVRDRRTPARVVTAS